MAQVIQEYINHPIYIIVLVAAVILTLFVCYKAGKASAKRNKEMNEIMSKLKEINKLRNKYAILTENLVNNSDSEELFKGVGLNLQKRVSDKTDMLQEFETLTTAEKYTYSFYAFYEDAEKGASEFFRANGQPITGLAKEITNKICDTDFTDSFNKLYDMYDEDNETVSFSNEVIAECNEKMAPFIENGTICKNMGDFIKDNINEFIR